MPPHPDVHVGVMALAQRNGKLALLKRGSTEGVSRHGYGTWSLPGGWVDYGEHPEDAVVRELEEEVGLIGRFPRLTAVVANTHPEGIHVVCVLYTFTRVEGELTNCEPEKCPEVRWAAPDELRGLELFAPLQSFVDGGFI